MPCPPRAPGLLWGECREPSPKTGVTINSYRGWGAAGLTLRVLATCRAHHVSVPAATAHPKERLAGQGDPSPAHSSCTWAHSFWCRIRQETWVQVKKPYLWSKRDWTKGWGVCQEETTSGSWRRRRVSEGKEGRGPAVMEARQLVGQRKPFRRSFRAWNAPSAG